MSINHSNYEVFYLDYLEGRLNETDSRDLLLFLEHNPELALVDSDLPTFIANEQNEVADWKEDLKVFDAQEIIDASTVEMFTIAAVENLLNPEKKHELDAFLEKNIAYKSTLNRYQKTILQPDLTVVYPNKKSLKRHAIHPLYWRSAFAAASVLLFVALLQFWPKQHSTFPNHDYLSAEFHPKKINLGSTNSPDQALIVLASKNKTDHLKPVHQNEQPIISSLALRHNTLIQVPVRKLDIEPLKLKAIPSSTPASSDETVTYLSLAEMKSPVKMLTDGIKKQFDKDVDFRTAQAKKNKQGGFYLKIGRLEITRKVAPTIDALASH